MQPALHARVFPSVAAHSAGEGVSDMINKDRGPEWQGDDSFGAGWGNQTVHDPQTGKEPVAGADFGAGATAGELTKDGYGTVPGGGFAIRGEVWRAQVEMIREH